MSPKNTLNNFKQIIGEYCAINQFIELSKRSFLSDHASLLADRSAFIKFADEHSIALTCYDSKQMVHSISLSYIVNTHLCFETFIKELYQQIKIYGKTPLQEKQQDESWLKCVCRNAYGTHIPEHTIAIFALCEYYRLVRNSAVHDLCNIETHSSVYKGLLKFDFNTSAKYAKLSAPNPYENICFDDFVMFSRSCIELASALYDVLELDCKKIISSLPDSIILKWKKYNFDRCKMAINLYITSNFKNIKISDKEIQDLIAIIAARSSNG